MNVNKTAILFLVLLFLSPTSTFALPTKDAPEKEYNDIAGFIVGGDLPTVMKMLDEIIEKYPQPLKALYLRAQLTWVSGKGEEALLFTARALELDPANTEVLLQNCIIRESMGEPKKQSLQCYNDALRTMKNFHPVEVLQMDGSYIFTLVLAESPEVDQAIKDFVKSCGDPAMGQEWERLRNFDRNELKRTYEWAKQRAKGGTPLF